ncbi:hypothetical protein U9M48_041558 [Paspalum notatum var. saurae]|uniref:protein-serine/threonine phosphatase n=1 Tax=Paspalum notatum var. saurae TaxID=547442 RepID=A0AAQ3XF02_PASNO
MGNRVARLAKPCFAPPDYCPAGPGVHGATSGTGQAAADDGCGSSSIGHILSFDGREGPAFAGAIHGVLLPSNQSTAGSASASSVLNDQLMSFSGSSSFDSSNSFSFRTLQPYSGRLDYSTSSPSTSATTSGVSLSRHPPRTDQQILADLYATRHRRQSSSKTSPLLAGLRRAVASALRSAGPCMSPGPTDRKRRQEVGNGAVISAAVDDGAAARVQWARGKAGEDRVHVVVSEEHGWMFVGIYDGFNGPDATDYLLAHLYAAVCRELDGVSVLAAAGEEEEGVHGVLGALARALRSTEAGYFAEAEARAAECPELAMMGSCVLVVLIKAADVYVMNVGDSRAVLAQRADAPDLSPALLATTTADDDHQDHHHHQLAAVKAEIKRQLDNVGEELAALQLTVDHSTSAYREARRIRGEHPDDPACIVNGRVKGSLKVTRAFGAGYLKEPRWNSALLEVFRVSYVGAAPYITCRPYLRHHRLGERDKFLILSSDGLYDYFTNDEVVALVDAFTARFPDEDPAKYLSHEILLRAANHAGMGFHELLEVQQGDRRRYHDDVSIIIISLEGKIWRWAKRDKRNACN